MKSKIRKSAKNQLTIESLTKEQWMLLVAVVVGLSVILGMAVGPEDALRLGPQPIHRTVDHETIGRLEPILKKIVEENPSDDLRRDLPPCLAAGVVGYSLEKFIDGGKRSEMTIAGFESNVGQNPTFNIYEDVIENTDIPFEDKQYVFFHEYVHFLQYLRKRPKGRVAVTSSVNADLWKDKILEHFDDECEAYRRTFELMAEKGYSVAKAELPNSLFRGIYKGWKEGGMVFVRQHVREALLPEVQKLERFRDEAIVYLNALAKGP